MRRGHQDFENFFLSNSRLSLQTRSSICFTPVTTRRTTTRKIRRTTRRTIRWVSCFWIMFNSIPSFHWSLVLICPLIPDSFYFCSCWFSISVFNAEQKQEVLFCSCFIFLLFSSHFFFCQYPPHLNSFLFFLTPYFIITHWIYLNFLCSYHPP